LDGPLAIVGYMGSGKTTVGRLTARRLGWHFVDLDREISRHANQAIPEIFAEHGEPYFRTLEHKLLKEALMTRTDLVVACGGGVVTRPENRVVLDRVTTLFLEEDPYLLYDRTRGVDRPLRGANLEAFLERYRERLPLYESVANHIIHVDGRSAGRVAREVVRWLRA
jgi:shikimate kinase